MDKIKKIINFLKKSVKFLQELCRKDNFAYFFSVINIIGIVLMIKNVESLWFPFMLIGSIGMFFYNWEYSNTYGMLLCFAQIVAMFLI